MKADEIVQMELCSKWGSEYVPANPQLKLGIAKNVQEGAYPINGLRHPLTDGLSGWFIWSGNEIEQKEDFFKPYHISHLRELFSPVIKYLGLAPGWRFILFKNHDDVWFDPFLLDID